MLTTLLQQQFCWEILQFSALLVAPKGCNGHYNHKYKSVVRFSYLWPGHAFLDKFTVGKAVGVPPTPTVIVGWNFIVGGGTSWG